MSRESRKIHETAWARNATRVDKDFGGYVNWEEEFYICPFCEEPVYAFDWEEEDLENFLCPICEDIDLEE